MNPQVEAFYHATTGSLAYVAYDTHGGHAAIIDAVLDYEPASARVGSQFADAIVAFVERRALHVEWILETHAHADHLSAAAELKRRLGGRTGIGARIVLVQATASRMFNLEPSFAQDGSQFDRLFVDDERFAIGSLEAKALFVGGHTPADVAYLIGDAAFIGDTLFMPDVGTARCDFPGGDPNILYRSVRRLLELPSATRLFVGHDYPPPTREPRWETSVEEERARNIHVHDGVTHDEFVAMRTARDATLEMPTLMLPSLQINVRAGELPPADADGMRYLRLPLNRL